MTHTATHSGNTRERLLAVAGRVFAEKGYQETTIADICLQAQANIASVNYHFRDKQTLYLEAWRDAFKRELTQYPADGGVSESASPERRLAGRIKSLVWRMADDNSYSFAIIHKELAQPTRLLADILEKEINPQRQAMFSLLEACLGPAANEQRVHYCHASIMGQCFQLLRIKQLLHSGAQANHLVKLGNIEAYAEHIVRFSLAGIQATQQQHSTDGILI